MFGRIGIGATLALAVAVALAGCGDEALRPRDLYVAGTIYTFAVDRGTLFYWIAPGGALTRIPRR